MTNFIAWMTYVYLFSMKKIIFKINNSQMLLYLSNCGYWSCMDQQNNHKRVITYEQTVICILLFYSQRTNHP